jgi:high-affinity nickel permease
MSMTTDPRVDGRTDADHIPVRQNRARRLVTETKASFKTTEFFAFIVILAGILIAAALVDESDAGGYGAKQAWLYATILTAGYMISRGLAKSGSHQPYDEDRS